MSKTLALKKPTESTDIAAAVAGSIEEKVAEASAIAQQSAIAVTPAFTREELLAMLNALPGGIQADPTQDLPTGAIPAHLIADRSKLSSDPADWKAGAAPQAPPAVHGKFGLNGIPLIAPGVDLGQTINPATGEFYIQPGPRQATQISPPPSRRFDGR